MRKSNNVVLLKAVAMSALLANGCMGTDSDEKYNKRPDKPSHNSRPNTELQSRDTSDGEESHAQYTAAEILAPLDARAKIAREVLSQPRNIDFAVSSIDTALKFLSYAKQYSVKVKLNLLNITQDDLNKILSENDGNIEELEWSYNVPPVTLTQDVEQDKETTYDFDTWYTVDDEEDFKTEGSIRDIRTNLRNNGEKYIEDDKEEDDKSLKGKEEKYKYIDDDKDEKDKYSDDYIKPVKYIEDDERADDLMFIEYEEDGERADDLMFIEYEEDDERADDLMFIEYEEDDDVEHNFIRDRFPNFNRNFHPNDVDNLPIRRRAASRGLRAPDLAELLNNAGQKGTPLVPPARNGVDNGVVPPREENPIAGGWKFTTLRNDIKNQDSSNFLSPKDHAKPPKQPNLVRFYCHQDPLLVRAR